MGRRILKWTGTVVGIGVVVAVAYGAWDSAIQLGIVAAGCLVALVWDRGSGR